MSQPVLDHIPSDIVHQVLSDVTGGFGDNPDVRQDIDNEIAINEILPGLKRGESTALLLDINNLFKRAQANDFRIDYVKLHSIIGNRCDLRYCGAFSAVDPHDRNAQSWMTAMRKNGYSVITRDLVRFTDRSGRVVSKGNMDVEMTISAMKLSEGFGHVILGTCDGDFIPLIDELKTGHFRKVSVMGICSPSVGGMNEALVRAADNFYDLNLLRDFISYHGQGRRHDPSHHSA